ncbi:hypothetical protein GINT2_001805 [Glugoides intestinalis]
MPQSIEMKIRSSENAQKEDEQQQAFEDEMRKLEECMSKGKQESIENANFMKKRRRKLRYTPTIERIVEEGIFGPAPAAEEDKVFINDNTNTGLGFGKFKEAVKAYKRDSKNFFLGGLLEQCSKRRKINDVWYSWNKEMLTSIDHNEKTMKQGLLQFGHEKLTKLLEESDINREATADENWASSMHEKVAFILDGLQSIQEMIRGEGLNTVWGTIQYKDVTLSRIQSSMTSFMKNENKIYDIIDYVKYKGRKLEEHYKKVREKIDRKNLYYQ